MLSPCLISCLFHTVEKGQKEARAYQISTFSRHSSGQLYINFTVLSFPILLILAVLMIPVIFSCSGAILPQQMWL